jgi:hypothetical protein
MSIAPIYRLHDWAIRSEVALAAAHLNRATEQEDLRIVMGQARTIPSAPPEGLPLALIEAPDGVALCRTSTGHTLRFYGLCDFDLDDQHRAMTVHLDPSSAPEVAELLLTSSTLSFLLELRAHCVIHASAVVFDQQAVAFIGPSGSGKSSLAAALCAQGLPLLTDDALRCDLSPTLRCHRGTLALRLRSDAKPLAALFDEQTSSVDGRIVIRPTPARHQSYDLALLVAPESGEDILLERAHGVAALSALLRAARVTAWCDLELASRQFQALASLARAVPIYRLVLPIALLDQCHGRETLQQLLEQVLRQRRNGVSA